VAGLRKRRYGIDCVDWRWAYFSVSFQEQELAILPLFPSPQPSLFFGKNPDVKVRVSGEFVIQFKIFN
jgi:hypothetical protein